jgi:hypothetical protein
MLNRMGAGLTGFLRSRGPSKPQAPDSGPEMTAFRDSPELPCYALVRSVARDSSEPSWLASARVSW